MRRKTKDYILLAIVWSLLIAFAAVVYYNL